MLQFDTGGAQRPAEIHYLDRRCPLPRIAPLAHFKQDTTTRYSGINGMR
jgi:hypothetical protein